MTDPHPTRSPITAGAVLLYDGDCAFCNASIAWLNRYGLLGYPTVAWQTRSRGRAAN